MPTTDTHSFFIRLRQNLWANNPATIQLLGLCPLLAVSTNLQQGLFLGLATIVVITLGNSCISLARHFIPKSLRLPCFMLILGSVTTAIELLLQAYFYDLYQVLGLFIPLIITNCTLLARAEAFASQQKLLPTFIDSLSTSLGFFAVLTLIGGLRELLTPYSILFALPPGAFLLFGLCVALQRSVERQAKNTARLIPVTPIE